jgi:hypothetical protein
MPLKYRGLSSVAERRLIKTTETWICKIRPMIRKHLNWPLSDCYITHLHKFRKDNSVILILNTEENPWNIICSLDILQLQVHNWTCVIQYINFLQNTALIMIKLGCFTGLEMASQNIVKHQWCLDQTGSLIQNWVRTFVVITVMKAASYQKYAMDSRTCFWIYYSFWQSRFPWQRIHTL